MVFGVFNLLDGIECRLYHLGVKVETDWLECHRDQIGPSNVALREVRQEIGTGLVLVVGRLDSTTDFSESLLV